MPFCKYCKLSLDSDEDYKCIRAEKPFIGTYLIVDNFLNFDMEFDGKCPQVLDEPILGQKLEKSNFLIYLQFKIQVNFRNFFFSISND